MKTYQLVKGKRQENGLGNITSNEPLERYNLNLPRHLFEVWRVESSSILELKSTQHTKLICWMASGKLRIQLDHTQPFHIGPQGMFIIRPGEKGSMVNQLPFDAVLQILGDD